MATRKKLADRHGATHEAKDIMTGKAYTEQSKPFYESKPGITVAEVQHQHLNAPGHNRGMLTWRGWRPE